MANQNLTNVGLLLLRSTGGLMATHGWGKFQWAIAETPKADWNKFVEGVGFLGFPQPAAFAWAAMLSELVGAAMVVLGIYPRVGAACLAVTMFVAAFLRHAEDPFGTKEKALVYLAAMLAVTFLGGGQWSVDQAWRKR